MTEQPLSSPAAAPRGPGLVTVIAVGLFGLLLGAIAWLAVTSDEPQVALRVALPPVPVDSAQVDSAQVGADGAPRTPSQSADVGRPAATIAMPPPPPEASAPAAPETTPAPPPPKPATPAAPQAAPPPPPAEPPQPAPQTATAPPESPAPSAVEQPAVRGLPAPQPDGLSPAPDSGLVEPMREGLLPVIGTDGRKPWQVYARPFDMTDKRPRVSLIISGLGQSSAATEAAIQRLPGAVTLAFSPYARTLDQWVNLSRAAGHEVLLALPMEPIGYPENDPGPHTLLTSLSERDNRDRLLYLLSRAPGYVGVLNSMGARLTTAPASLKPVLQEIRDRGLLFVDARSSLRSVAASQASELGLPRAINNRFIDIKAARGDIDQRLDELERIARQDGYALGIGSPYPITIERVLQWTQQLESKGIALAPISALVDLQTE